MVIENIKADSIVIVETLRDTTVIVEPDSALISALLECDSMGRVRIVQLLEYQAGERMKPPKITVNNNILTSEAIVDSMAIFLQLKNQYKETISTKITTQTKEVNVLTWWQRFWIKVGKISTIALIVCVSFHFIRRRYGF